MSYQGHKNWNHWNVSLWLFNEYDTYKMMQAAISITNTRDNAARYILKKLPPKTPDGAPYTYASVRAALVGWES